MPEPHLQRPEDFELPPDPGDFSAHQIALWLKRKKEARSAPTKAR